ncbi:MAG: type II toxin-antitoxin system antitoxin SocA domain-containing protein [Nitrospirota bacterium]
MAISQNLDAVQKAIIRIHRELFDESPTPMKLQKLCYYAQGYALAEGEELFSDEFQAWQHGPVIFDLYTKYKKYQWRQISDEIMEFDYARYDFIKDIVSAYGRFDGAALSTMTHRETPWVSARGELDESEGCNEIMPKDSLRDFFEAKLKANG